MWQRLGRAHALGHRHSSATGSRSSVSIYACMFTLKVNKKSIQLHMFVNFKASVGNAHIGSMSDVATVAAVKR